MIRGFSSKFQKSRTCWIMENVYNNRTDRLFFYLSGIILSMQMY